MSNVAVDQQYMDPKPKNISQFDLASYASKTFGMYGGKETQVTIELDQSLLNYVKDRFGTDLKIKVLVNKQISIRVNIVVSPTFFSWLVQFKDKVKITAPLDVIHSFQDFLRSILKSY
jgi:hypothetical protein